MKTNDTCSPYYSTCIRISMILFECMIVQYRPSNRRMIQVVVTQRNYAVPPTDLHTSLSSLPLATSHFRPKSAATKTTTVGQTKTTTTSALTPACQSPQRPCRLLLQVQRVTREHQIDTRGPRHSDILLLAETRASAAMLAP